MRALVEKGKMPQGKFLAVLKHGNRVLEEANLKRMSFVEREKEMERMLRCGDVAPWEQWRLVIDGVEYRPKYGSEEEWSKAYDND
jgi:hypothetical protein